MMHSSEVGQTREVRWRTVAGLVLLGTVIGLLGFLLLPSQCGGLTTYGQVKGHSMEPNLHDGTLVVAREQTSYRIGDVVIYTVHGGHIMHRIVDGSAAYGWVTRGDNTLAPDRWNVPDESILGQVILVVPGAGAAMRYAAGQPLIVAGVTTTLAALCYLPRRRRKVTPELEAALRTSVAEPPMPQATRDRPLIGLMVVATVCAFGAGLVALVVHAPLWPAQAVTLGCLLACAWSLEAVNSATYSGHGLREPLHTMVTLSGHTRWWPVRIPSDERVTTRRTPVMVNSPAQLCDLSDAYRLPILHRVDPVTGRSDYALITAHRDYVWEPHWAPPGSR